MTLDLTTPITSLDEPPTVDLEPGRDKVRSALAVGLLILLACIVAMGFVLVFTVPTDVVPGPDGTMVRVDSRALLEARSMFAQSMLSVVAGLFGAATGFYFGTSQNRH